MGEIECYSLLSNRRVLMQLVTATHIRLEGITAGASSGDPGTWAFGADAVEFER